MDPDGPDEQELPQLLVVRSAMNELANILSEERTTELNKEAARYMSIAITQIQTASLWVLAAHEARGENSIL